MSLGSPTGRIPATLALIWTCSLYDTVTDTPVGTHVCYQPGTRVIFYEGNTAKRGIVQGIESVENMQVAVVSVEGTNAIIRIPINVLTRDG